MLQLSLPRLSPGAGHRRPARLTRAAAQAESALARLAGLLEAEVECRAERGDGTGKAWGLLCQVEALLAELKAERTAAATAPPDGAGNATPRAD
ncbi:MAG TPA: hypothetical protein VFY87_18280 [Geminicoccaceae bacterium]|jgi:hypothetical protein|nr:hypothetical protein [Geminicoccaceae bacterium]